MLKHVQLSPFRSRSDSVSLSSTLSYASLPGGGVGPEDSGGRCTLASSRASSYSSLSDASSICSSSSSSTSPSPTPLTTTIKVYARCLRPDIEYKTLGVTFDTTSRQVVSALLGKYRMRHRDPNLFYLTMEVGVRGGRLGNHTVLVLDEEARPAELQSCHPRGDSRFSLQTRRGGLVKIYDSVLMTGSQYKSILISDRTTVDELIQILLNCYNSKERVEQFSLYEVCKGEEYERKLHPDDSPLQVQMAWQASPRRRIPLLAPSEPRAAEHPEGFEGTRGLKDGEVGRRGLADALSWTLGVAEASGEVSGRGGLCGGAEDLSEHAQDAPPAALRQWRLRHRAPEGSSGVQTRAPTATAQPEAVGEGEKRCASIWSSVIRIRIASTQQKLHAKSHSSADILTPVAATQETAG
ncbi:uncharacterized protein LOC124169108 isoform X2 [Ischnura elegans]|uniref:uncharacterized protein LOC124169108 isoform X2 n=1 Tax=Ischnura elegans TaxID=197161 RepID=UPI001ED870B1|nr:uncharacterized protein LOC124169108 isoform X2 [Ischnura elegans]